MDESLELRLLSAHGSALLFIASDPQIQLSSLAAALGVDEGDARTLVQDLIVAGYVDHQRQSERDVYRVITDLPIDQPREGRGATSLVRALASSVDVKPKSRLEVTFEQSGIGTVIVGLDGTLQRVNQAACDLFDQTANRVVGRFWSDFTHPDDASLWQALLERVISGQHGVADERRYVRPDGSIVWTTTYINLVSDDNNQPLFYLVQLPDISDRKSMERQLDFQSLHDSLTGLANRTQLINRLEHGLSRLRRRGTQIGVIFLNIDHFKLINHSLGHEVGDELLCLVGARLTASLRPTDSVARIGADEFAVVCKETVALETEFEAHKILDALSAPFTFQGQHLLVTASLGLAIGREDSTPETILLEAETAANRAKELGRHRVETYDEVLKSKAERRGKLLVGLRTALERNQFTVHYQPIVDPTSGHMASAEALLRWSHPELGEIGPGEFIPLTEEMGLIGEIGRWVVEQACGQLARWQKSGHNLSVAVNVSVLQMMDADMTGSLEKILRRSGARAEGLCLELTESLFMEDANYFVATLTELKDIGTKIALDDFGTGFSSLDRLKRFPIDQLKVDQSFVKGLGVDARDTALVDAIVAMAHALNLSVTAEGVETKQQLDHLTSLGCERVQGYYLARPMPAAAINQLVEDAHRWERVASSRA